MSETTTLRVSRATHQELRERAHQDGLTMEAELKRMLRYDRQRRMAEAFAAGESSPDDQAIVRGGTAAVARNLDATG